MQCVVVVNDPIILKNNRLPKNNRLIDQSGEALTRRKSGEIGRCCVRPTPIVEGLNGSLRTPATSLSVCIILHKHNKTVSVFLIK